MRPMAHLYHLTIVFISCTCIVCVRVYRALNLFIFFFFINISKTIPKRRTFGFFGQIRLRLIPYVFVCSCTIHNIPILQWKKALHCSSYIIRFNVVFSSLSRSLLLFPIAKVSFSNRKHSSYLPYTSEYFFLYRICVLRTNNEPLIHSRSAFISFALFFIWNFRSFSIFPFLAFFALRLRIGMDGWMDSEMHTQQTYRFVLCS